MLAAQIFSYYVQTGEFVLHTGSSHWITISTIGTEHPGIHVYDSLYTSASQQLQIQIASIIHTNSTATKLKTSRMFTGNMEQLIVEYLPLLMLLLNFKEKVQKSMFLSKPRCGST